MTEPNGIAPAPLPPFPPEWVALADLPRWVARIYNVDATAVALDLIPAVRGRLELQHRVPGIKAKHPSTYQKRLPAGLHQQGDNFGKPISANDWEAAEADWMDGTVGGWGDPGARERLPIEVSWDETRFFVEIRTRGWLRNARRDEEKLEKTAKHERDLLEARRAGRISSFRERQRDARQWIEVKDLVSFLSLPKGLDRNVSTTARDWFSDLKSSFERGEFDVGHKARLLFLCPGQWTWGRLTRQRVTDLPDDYDGHTAWLEWCWVPRDLLAVWLQHRGIKFPQHMLPDGGRVDGGCPPTPTRDPNDKRVKYSNVLAKRLLAAAKYGEFQGRIPTEIETLAVLRRHFSGVSNEPHRVIRKELWPENRSGPRKKAAG